MNKFMERLMKQNFKKIGINFLIVSLIMVVAGSVTLYSNFNSRLVTWKAQMEKTEQEYVNQRVENSEQITGTKEFDEHSYNFKDSREDREHFGNYHKRHHFDLEDSIVLTAKDKAIIGITGLAAVMLLVSYWMLVALWVTQYAVKVGANPLIWGILTLVFNLVSVVVFLICYSVKQKCPVCNKVHKVGIKHCKNCGTALTKTCNQCGNEIKSTDNYCSHCGKHNE